MNTPAQPGSDHSELFGRPALQAGEGAFLTGVKGRQTVNAAPLLRAVEPVAETNEFVGAWFPTAVDSTHIDLTAGSLSDGSTTYTPDVTGIAVHASSLNYVYLECDLTPTVVDGITIGGTVDAVAVVAYTTTKTNTSSKGYVLLCEWQASAIVARYRYYSMEAEIWRDGFRTWTAA
jgi:hypothetical protein